MAGFIAIFVLNYKKLSSNMAQTSQQIDYKNQETYYYDKTSKMIVNLGSKKCDKNNDSSSKITCLNNSLLLIIVDNPGKYLSHSEGKAVTSKLC